MLIALSALVLIFGALAYYLDRKLDHLDRVYSILSKRLQAVDLTLQRIEKSQDLDRQIVEKTRRLENPSTDLREFLVDLAEEGCGIVRIHPGSILIRGIRK